MVAKAVRARPLRAALCNAPNNTELPHADIGMVQEIEIEE
jgi:hypothetical protein